VALNIRAILLLITFSLMLKAGYGQSAIFNGDFESYTALPSASGEIDKVQLWDGLEYSPDFYHSSSFGPVYPEFGGTYSGNCMIGLGTDGQDPGGAECIGQDISANPILASAVCSVGAYAKEDTWYLGSCTTLELYGFSNPQTPLTGMNHISDWPGAVLLWSSELVDDTLWQKYEGTFVSPSKFEYIVYSLSSTPSCDQYVYLDSVFLSVNGLGYEQLINSRFQIYPNPAKDLVTIRSSSDLSGTEIAIYDLTGSLVYSKMSGWTNPVNIDLSDFSSGTYLVQLSSAKGVRTEKLIIR